MNALVEAAAKKLSVKRTGFEYDLLLPSQQLELCVEVQPVIEACGAEELLKALSLIAAPFAPSFDEKDGIPTYEQVIHDYTLRVAIARNALAKATGAV